MTKPTTINTDAATATAIDARRRSGETRSNRLTTDLTAYYTLLADGLRKARRTLTPNQAALVLNVFNATAPGQIWTANRIAARVDDAIVLDGMGDKWDVDGATLVAALRDMGDFAAVALADWADSVWSKGDFDVAAETTIFKG